MFNMITRDPTRSLRWQCGYIAGNCGPNFRYGTYNGREYILLPQFIFPPEWEYLDRTGQADGLGHWTLLIAHRERHLIVNR